MDFAKKILVKYGWKEGDGLGKNNHGITKPLKASLKFDNAGLGVDRAKEFNDHWWERCFNEAAKNVDVQVKQNGTVSTSRKQGEDAVEISTKGYCTKKLKKAKEQRAHEGGTASSYDNFLQSATLTQNGGEVNHLDGIKGEDIAVTTVSVLSDEELFKACGGRTAHKGARHGLKLSGKLARLEQQEREMLEKLQKKQHATEHKGTQKQNRHAKSKEKILAEKETEMQQKRKTEEVPEEPVKSKKKKKKHKNSE